MRVRHRARVSFPKTLIFQQRDACTLCDLCGILIPPFGSVTSDPRKGRNVRAEGGGSRGSRGRARGCRTGKPPAVRAPRLISGDRLPPRSPEALQGRAPSHHLWPRNVSPSHITPFHRRFRRYSISGNTAAHLHAALNNRAAWRRESVPEERCFSKPSHLSTRFFLTFFFFFLCLLVSRDLSNPF